MVAAIASRFSRPRRVRTSSSSGQRCSPFSKPWVIDAEQKPPLRPDAAHPMREPSRSSTSRDGSASLASRAVHRPEKPPPTTSRSVRAVPEKGSSASGRRGSSSQNDSGEASATAAYDEGRGVRANGTTLTAPVLAAPGPPDATTATGGRRVRLILPGRRQATSHPERPYSITSTARRAPHRASRAVRCSRRVFRWVAACG